MFPQFSYKRLRTIFIIKACSLLIFFMAIMTIVEIFYMPRNSSPKTRLRNNSIHQNIFLCGDVRTNKC